MNAEERAETARGVARDLSAACHELGIPSEGFLLIRAVEALVRGPDGGEANIRLILGQMAERLVDMARRAE